MDNKKALFNYEQKKAYRIFSKDALIEIIMLKNKQIIELQSVKFNKPDVISSGCDCKQLENGKIVMCQKCLVNLTGIE